MGLNDNSDPLVKSTPSDQFWTVSLKKNRLCQLLMMTTFVLCLAGFAYQVTEFLTHFYTYPTVVDIQVEKPESFLAPSFTFCNTNRLKRTKYCAKFPDRCVRPRDMQAFCTIRPHYCKGDIANFTIPEEIVDVEGIVDAARMNTEELGHDAGTFFVDSESRTGMDGPFFFNLPNGHLYPCFTQNSRQESPLEPVMKRFAGEGSYYTTMGQFKLDVEADEYFDPRTVPSALVGIHSPFFRSNPYYKGILVIPGNTYIIHMKLEEKRLLPYPYKTDCIDYIEIWKSNNRTGPRSQEMCQERCDVDFIMTCHRCSVPSVYVKWEDICQIRGIEFCDNEEELMRKRNSCQSQCKADCVKLKYEYRVEERSKIVNYTDHKSDIIDIRVLIDDSEILVLTHKPQYLMVELFSYIGGFLGCWLGISLWSFVEYCRSVLTTIVSLYLNDRKPLKIDAEP